MPPVHAEVTPLCSTTRSQGAESEMEKVFGKRMFEAGMDDCIKHLTSFLQTVRSLCAIHKTSDQTKLNIHVGIFLGKHTQQKSTT